MTRERFMEMLAGLEGKERAIVGTKGEEYTHGSEDRLSSFKETAAFAGITPLQVCMVFMMKHVQALASYAKREKTLSDETLEGRVTDVRLYAALFAALAEEQKIGECLTPEWARKEA